MTNATSRMSSTAPTVRCSGFPVRLCSVGMVSSFVRVYPGCTRTAGGSQMNIVKQRQNSREPKPCTGVDGRPAWRADSGRTSFARASGWVSRKPLIPLLGGRAARPQGLYAGVDLAARQPGPDRIAGLELRGIFDKRALGVEDQRIAALQDGDRRERRQLCSGLLQARLAAQKRLPHGRRQGGQPSLQLALPEFNLLSQV